jgi:hypothetical protein
MASNAQDFFLDLAQAVLAEVHASHSDCCVP